MKSNSYRATQMRMFMKSDFYRASLAGTQGRGSREDSNESIVPT